MPKGYWIARVDVTNAEGYQGYVAANGAAFKKYGARFMVRGGAFEAPEGKARARNVVLEFPDYATAVACYHSPRVCRREGAPGRRGGGGFADHRGIRWPAALTTVRNISCVCYS